MVIHMIIRKFGRKNVIAAPAALILALSLIMAGCGAAVTTDAVTTPTTEAAATVQTTAATTAAATEAAVPVTTEEIKDVVIDAEHALLRDGAGDALPPVAQVAGIAVTQPEYRYMLNSYKSALLLNTGIVAGTDEDVNFWNRTAANGKTRMDEARERVLSELHQIKICEALAESRGIRLEDDELGNISTDLRAQENRFGGRADFEKILKDEYGITLSDYWRISESIMLRELLMADEMRSITVADGDIRAFYDQNPDEYGDLVRFKLILLLMEGADIKSERTAEQTEKLANETLEAINGGADFNALIREKSEDPGVVQNNGERVVTKADPYIPGDVLEWLFAAGEGDCTVIETSFGFYIVRLEERVARSFDDVKTGIESALREQKLAAQVSEWLKDPAYAMKIDRVVLESIA